MAGYRSPVPPLRVAFLGEPTIAAAHVMHDPANGVVPRFFDVRAGADLADFAPDVVVAIAPDGPPAVDAATLAVVGPHDPVPDGFDRVLGTPGTAGVWRARPLPIDDRLYGDPRPSSRPPRALFVGRSTERREWILTPAKHSHDVVHYTHGLTGAKLKETLEHTDVGVALTADGGHGFPSQALLHLAAGQLLVTAKLQPTCGLEAGIDYLQMDSRDALVTILMQLELRPDAYERVRIRGRLKAEEHRASRVWPRIVADLLQDLRVFGNTLNA